VQAQNSRQGINSQVASVGSSAQVPVLTARRKPFRIEAAQNIEGGATDKELRADQIPSLGVSTISNRSRSRTYPERAAIESLE
jgi:hypothetical protein